MKARIFKFIIPALIILGGVTICIFAIYNYFNEEENMVLYASLCISLFVGLVVMDVGMAAFGKGK